MIKGKEFDAYFAVFNGHVNRADKRARKVMEDHFISLFKQLEKIEKKHSGIMGIFQESPKQATMVYIALVTAFVNKY